MGNHGSASQFFLKRAFRRPRGLASLEGALGPLLGWLACHWPADQPENRAFLLKRPYKDRGPFKGR